MMDDKGVFALLRRVKILVVDLMASVLFQERFIGGTGKTAFFVEKRQKTVGLLLNEIETGRIVGVSYGLPVDPLTDVFILPKQYIFPLLFPERRLAQTCSYLKT